MYTVLVFIVILGSVVLFKKLIGKPKATNVKKIIIKDTLAEAKKNIQWLFNAIDRQNFSEMHKHCTKEFIEKTNYGKALVLDSVPVDYYLEKDYQDSASVIITSKYYEIKNNVVKFFRINDQLKIQDVI